MLSNWRRKGEKEKGKKEGGSPVYSVHVCTEAGKRAHRDPTEEGAGRGLPRGFSGQYNPKNLVQRDWKRT